MIYNKREYLSILQIEDDTNQVGFEILGKLLFDRPLNVVYCEKGDKLLGIITMGDVYRAKTEGQRTVKLNTMFTCLHGFEYMKARTIFLESEKINALPIVDEEHRLIGDYSRWDDVFSNYKLKFLKSKMVDVLSSKKGGKLQTGCNLKTECDVFRKREDFKTMV